jgi:type I restriction enzyme, S subunit
MSTWREYSVEDVAANAPHALATGPFGSSISSRFFQTDGIPVIRGGNLSQDVGTRLVDDDWVFISEEKAAEFSRSIVQRGDLVFTCWGTIDQVGLIDDSANHPKYVISNKQMKLTPDPARFDSHFLYYLFKSPSVREHIRSIAIGSSVPGFNLGQLRSMRLRAPELAEQRAIARVLCVLDDKIQLNRRMNHDLEELARVLFTSWFVDFDPVAAKRDGRTPIGVPAEAIDLFPSHFEDSELGPIPQGWGVTRIGEAFELNPKRELQDREVAPYLEMSAMPTVGHAPEHWESRAAGSGMRFMNGDTLMARITPCLENGKTAFVDFLEPGEVGWGSTEYIVIRSRRPMPLVTSYLLARSEDFRAFAIQGMTGSSGRQRVGADLLGRYKLALPRDSRLLKAFGTIVEPLFAMARANSVESRTLAELRDTLLGPLLSGGVTIKAAEKAVGAAV